MTKNGFAGFMIKLKRLEKNWSQAGLCRGICSVSYLSKIEQGQSEPSEDLLRLLFSRLGVDWAPADRDEKRRAEIEDAYDKIFSLDPALRDAENAEDCAAELSPADKYAPEALIISAWQRHDLSAFPRELCAFLSPRGRALFMILDGRSKAAAELLPSALTLFSAGRECYEAGSYSAAIEYLQRGHDLAAKDGLVYVMMDCRMLIGCCYSNMLEYGRMEQHFLAAKRLAKAVGDEVSLKTADYNTASTDLELGRYERAYAYFSTAENKNIMSLHKLAVCCEALGKNGEALAALDSANAAEQDVPEKAFALEICSLVRFRLEHPDYLALPEYGEKLLACFGRMRKELPPGYAGFHLPWVAEWYKANRKYKEAYELLLDFPAYGALSAANGEKLP